MLDYYGCGRNLDGLFVSTDIVCEWINLFSIYFSFYSITDLRCLLNNNTYYNQNISRIKKSIHRKHKSSLPLQKVYLFFTVTCIISSSCYKINRFYSYFRKNHRMFTKKIRPVFFHIILKD